MNSSLSEEQRRRIEENRKKALEKRAAAIKAKADSEARRLIPSAASTSNNARAKNNAVSCSISPNRPVSTAVCRMDSIRHRFIVEMRYNAQAIALFKTIKGYQYEPTTKRWSFPRSAYNKVIEHLKSLTPKVNVYPLPEPGDITKILLNAGTKTWNRDVDLGSIDPFLVQALRVFQREGVCFGICREGLVLIADDMGLGKTIQALGIANFYHNDWPLLIVSPSSMKYTWQESIWNWLPSVPPKKVIVVEGNKQDEESLQDAQVLILSYGLLCRRVSEPLIKNCKVVIIDESHYIKNFKTARAKAALPIIESAKRAILLSGTPALSSPIELYTQLTAISPDYRKMFPRQKVVVKLDPIKLARTKHGNLFEKFGETGRAKVEAVKNYVKQLVEQGRKFICFAHHKCVLDGVSEVLEDINCSYIRIEGSTPSKDRKRYVDEFQQNDNCLVAVLSITASAGITLTAASLVVFAELYWNPGILTQAEDRAHRIGQENCVIVQYLVANGTADDDIWKLVKNKSAVLNNIGLSNDNFGEVGESILPLPQKETPSGVVEFFSKMTR